MIAEDLYTSRGFAKDYRCAQGSSAPVYDYSVWGRPAGVAEGGITSFMGEVDIAAFHALVLWVSLGHAFFTLPNRCHHASKKGMGAQESRPTVSSLLLGNWVVAGVALWNAAGIVLVNIAAYAAALTPGCAVVCSASMLWSVSMHAAWSWLGKQRGPGSDEAKEECEWEEEESPWVEFSRVNEGAFSSPMLLVCCMACMRDQHAASSVQYVFGFVTAGVLLLIPMGAMSSAINVSRCVLFFGSATPLRRGFFPLVQIGS